MKTGQVTYWMEIPVTIDYSLHPAERETPTYPGCQKHIIVDFFSIPSEDEINALIYSKESDEIQKLCMEDADEPPDWM